MRARGLVGRRYPLRPERRSAAQMVFLVFEQSKSINVWSSRLLFRSKYISPTEPSDRKQMRTVEQNQQIGDVARAMV